MLPTVGKESGKKLQIYTNSYPRWLQNRVKTAEFTRIYLLFDLICKGFIVPQSFNKIGCRLHGNTSFRA